MTDTVLTYKGRPITDLTKNELVDAMTWAFQAIEYQRERSDRLLSAAAPFETKSELTPMSVSEPPPKPEDRNSKGECWWFCLECPGEYSHWVLAKEVYCNPTHWLPANTLPLPQ